MKKIVLLVGLLVASVGSFIIVKQVKRLEKKSLYAIGILQTASHPALDAARDGFIDELKKRMGADIEFVIRNAQGSIVNAQALAHQLYTNKQFNGFFAIATPAAQALASVEKERPIIIAAVTDPDALGLVHPLTNITGTKDAIDVKEAVEMLIQLVPRAKTVALVYTSGEINSTTLAQAMHKELAARGLQSIDFTASGESDIPAVAELAFRKSDVVLTPTDNTIASAISVLVSFAQKYKKPLIVSDNMLVASGALAARGVDYKESGKHAADIAYDVLVNDKKPYDILIEQAKSDRIFINKKTLSYLGLVVPSQLQSDVVMISS